MQELPLFVRAARVISNARVLFVDGHYSLILRLSDEEDGYIFVEDRGREVYVQSRGCTCHRTNLQFKFPTNILRRTSLTRHLFKSSTIEWLLRSETLWNRCLIEIKQNIWGGWNLESSRSRHCYLRPWLKYSTGNIGIETQRAYWIVFYWQTSLYFKLVLSFIQYNITANT